MNYWKTEESEGQGRRCQKLLSLHLSSRWTLEVALSRASRRLPPAFSAAAKGWFPRALQEDILILNSPQVWLQLYLKKNGLFFFFFLILGVPLICKL